MSKLDKITEKVMKFAQLRYVKIIMNAFMGIAAFSIGASLFSLVKSIPIGPWQTFLTTSGFGNILSIPINMVSNLYAIMVVLCVGYETAKSFGQRPLPAAMVAFGSFMIVTPFEATVSLVNEAGETITGLASNVLSLSVLGSQGIFVAMICGLIGARLYVFLLEKNIKIKMPDSIPPSVAGMFETMIPAGLVFILFMAVRMGFAQTASFRGDAGKRGGLGGRRSSSVSRMGNADADHQRRDSRSDDPAAVFKSEAIQESGPAVHRNFNLQHYRTGHVRVSDHSESDHGAALCPVSGNLRHANIPRHADGPGRTDDRRRAVQRHSDPDLFLDGDQFDFRVNLGIDSGSGFRRHLLPLLQNRGKGGDEGRTGGK